MYVIQKPNPKIGLLKWCGAGSNRRHKDFQSFALPTELPHHPVWGCKYRTSHIICKKIRRFVEKRRLKILKIKGLLITTITLPPQNQYNRPLSLALNLARFANYYPEFGS